MSLTSRRDILQVPSQRSWT